MSWYTPWTDAHEAALRGHLKAGHLSYSGIAAAMHDELNTSYSRNACIGKAARLGLANPYYAKWLNGPRKPRKPQVYKPRPKRQPMFVPIEVVQLRCSELLPEHVGIVEVVGCRWPYGEGPFTFCNHEQLEDSSYCGLHFQLSLRRNG